MSGGLASILSPMPASISTSARRSPAAAASPAGSGCVRPAGATRSHSGFGTTPNIAPPSSREEAIAERDELEVAERDDGDARQAPQPVADGFLDPRTRSTMRGRPSRDRSGVRADRVHDRRQARRRRASRRRVPSKRAASVSRSRNSLRARRRCLAAPRMPRRNRSTASSELRHARRRSSPPSSRIGGSPVLRRGLRPAERSRQPTTVRSAPSRSALFTTKMSAISMMPALSACTSSPVPGTSTTIETSAVRTMSTSSCPTPTVSMMTTSLAGGIEHERGVARWRARARRGGRAWPCCG